MYSFHTDWLFTELPVLIEKGILTEETAEKIKSYYKNQNELIEIEETKLAEKLKAEKPAHLSQRLPIILSLLSVILIAGGIISLIAYNWAAIPRLAKSLTAIFMLLITQSFGVYLKIAKKNISVRTKESFSLFWALLFGAAVAFISQIYRFPSNTTGFLLVWAISSILVTYIFSSSSTFILALIQIFAYMIAAWDENLAIFHLLVAALVPFVLQKESIKWHKQALFSFAAILFVPMIFRLAPLQSQMIFFSAYSALFLGFIFMGDKEKRTAASFCLSIFSVILVAILSNSDLIEELTFSKTGTLFEHILTYIVFAILILVSLGQPLYRKFFKKEGESFFLSLAFIPLIFPFVIYLSDLNSRIAFSVLTLCSLAFFVIFVLRDKSTVFLFFLGFSSLCECAKGAFYGFSLLSLSFYTLFLVSLLLVRENLLQSKIKGVFFILFRIFIAALFVFFYISVHYKPLSLNIDESSIVRSMLLKDLLLFLPQLAVPVWAVVTLAKNQPRKLISNADIFLNLILLIVMEFLEFVLSANILLAACNALILLNAAFAAGKYIFFRKSDFLPYLPIALAQTFVLCCFNGKESDFLWTITAAAFLLHLYGKTTNFQKISKICTRISTVTNGIIFFLEAVFFMCLCEIPVSRYVFPTNVWTTVYITFFLVLCVALCICLILKKELFNIAMLFHICLFTENESMQIIALPALTIFCLYYFFTAYKENSAKKANITAIYFTAVLMIRFFTLGYGLVSQGIALISLGVVLLLINRFLRKKQ